MGKVKVLPAAAGEVTADSPMNYYVENVFAPPIRLLDCIKCKQNRNPERHIFMLNGTLVLPLNRTARRSKLRKIYAWKLRIICGGNK